jgi:hypothetical protein
MALTKVVGNHTDRLMVLLYHQWNYTDEICMKTPVSDKQVNDPELIQWYLTIWLVFNIVKSLN